MKDKGGARRDGEKKDQTEVNSRKGLKNNGKEDKRVEVKT